MGKVELDSRSRGGDDRETTFVDDACDELFLGWLSNGSRQSMASDGTRNVSVPDSKMTVAQFVEARFVPEHVRFKSRAGQIHYQAALKHLIAPEIVNRIFNPGRISHARLKFVSEWPYLDKVRLCDLHSGHVRDLITAANAADYSAQTVKHIRNVLFAVISHAQREGCFNGPNPASEVKLPKITREKQHHLTFEQVKAVLQTLSSPLQEIAMFAISTDMNLGETCDLQWKHVNLNDTERMVDGERIPARSLAVRRAGNRADLWINKPARNSRIIEIQEPLFSSLRQLSQRNQSFRGDARVIVSDKGAPIPASVRTYLSKQLAKASGVPWLTWQVLRRTRSSFYADFLSQLSAPRLQEKKLGATTQFDASEMRSNERVDGSTKTLACSQHRSFCFGRRRQGLTEGLLRDE